MTPKKNKEIFERFPKIFAQRHLPARESAMCFGFEHDDGWYQLIWDLCEELEATGEDVQAVQVKEKFGTLRFYTNKYTEQSEAIIRKYEQLSATTCEGCGDTSTAHPRGHGWVRTECDGCHAKRQG